jgi:hypothetical protein
MRRCFALPAAVTGRREVQSYPSPALAPPPCPFPISLVHPPAVGRPLVGFSRLRREPQRSGALGDAGAAVHVCDAAEGV